jgi:hypothetical protein
MSRATKQQYEFASGKTGLLRKAEVKPTQFEVECQRLTIDPEETKAQLQSVELRSWVRSNRDTRYVPSILLSRMNLRTIYDEGRRDSYPLSGNAVISEQQTSPEDLPEAA